MKSFEVLPDETIHLIWEVHLLEITYFLTLPQISDQSEAPSPFELSLLTGMMAHPASSFITGQSTFSVRMEWFQDHMI